jgi:hypothetical protein
MPGKGKPFAKGVSGNPKGRPKKGDSWADILHEAFGETVRYKGTKKTWKRLIAEALRKQCLKGSIAAIEMAIKMDGQLPESDEMAEDSYEVRIRKLRHSRGLTGKTGKGKMKSLNVAVKMKELEAETEKEKKISLKKARAQTAKKASKFFEKTKDI